MPIFKTAPCETDVHVPAVAADQAKKPTKGKARSFKELAKDYWALRNMGKTKDAMCKNLDVSLSASIIKTDAEEHTVTGWASVIEEGGKPVVDWQGDVLSEEELTKAAHSFMSNYRISKAMHEGGAVGDVVESMVFTKDLQKALGIDLGKIGWLIKVKVGDPDVWDQVKKGTLKAFSIGGKGVRTKF